MKKNHLAFCGMFHRLAEDIHSAAEGAAAPPGAGVTG